MLPAPAPGLFCLVVGFFLVCFSLGFCSPRAEQAGPAEGAVAAVEGPPLPRRPGQPRGAAGRTESGRCGCHRPGDTLRVAKALALALPRAVRPPGVRRAGPPRGGHGKVGASERVKSEAEGQKNSPDSAEISPRGSCCSTLCLKIE